MKSEEEQRGNERNITYARKAFFSKYPVLKVVLSVVLVVFAITRFSHESLSTRMDLVFLSLFLSAFLLWMLPWEDLWIRLQGVSVGGVAISLQEPDIKAAVDNISFDKHHLELCFAEIEARHLHLDRTPEKVRDRLREELIRRLKSLEEELQTLRGSRILWIDDHPYNVLGERRLLRALGIDVTPASSSKAAQDILEKDNDFELIITDVQRRGASCDAVDKGTKEHEGVKFIVKLRKEAKDPRIKTLPVIFYGAYPKDELVKHTRPARALQSGLEISNSVVDLIPRVITTLSEEREHPIPIPAKPRGPDLD